MPCPSISCQYELAIIKITWHQLSIYESLEHEKEVTRIQQRMKLLVNKCYQKTCFSERIMDLILYIRVTQLHLYLVIYQKVSNIFFFFSSQPYFFYNRNFPEVLYSYLTRVFKIRILSALRYNYYYRVSDLIKGSSRF